jgi:quercetin dioxygenase-like cupin family protein
MSIVHKFLDFNDEFIWENVVGEDLTDEGLINICKHVVIGDSEKAPHFYMRYFHVGPNGHSRLERHPQEHEVIVLLGQGQVRIADQVTHVKPFDIIFIAGNELHQFINPGDSPFGFICVIPNR